MSHTPILVAKDPFSSYKVSKEDVPDLPFRIEIVGKSQYAGKTNLILNLVLRPMEDEDVSGKNFYKHDFDGADIYMISPSLHIDHKLGQIIEYKDIPAGNVFDQYSEMNLDAIYGAIKGKYEEAIRKGDRPVQSLVILDDCSFSGGLKEKLHGALAKIFCNGRHMLISVILTSQKYSDILTVCRENYTCMMLFECSDKQLDLIYEDVGTMSKKVFKKLFREATAEPHSFMVVNAKFPPNQRYQDMTFKPLAWKE